MRLRPVATTLAAAVVATLAATAPAHAQAPGQWAAPPPPPGAADPAAPAAPPAFTQRWSIGLGVGSLRVVEGTTDTEASFDVAQIALRYRATAHLELEASGGGGSERYEDGTEGSLAAASFTLAARYRFNPQDRLNWFVLAGFGGTTIAPKDASDQVVEDSQRGHGLIGAGVEYRFGRFALQGELRAYAFGLTQAEHDLMEAYGMDSGPELTGTFGQLGAAYYF